MSAPRYLAQGLCALALVALSACDDLPFAGDDDAGPDFDVVQIDAATNHACARTRDGSVYCWGDNRLGQLGTGDTEPRYEAVRVVLPGRASAMSASWGGGCAIVGGDIFCWGSDRLSRADYWNPDDSIPQLELTVRGAWRAVMGPSQAYDGHRCAIDTSDRAWCWGHNDGGMLGDGTTENSEEPKLVLGGHRWRTISVGSYITCGVASDRRGYCWGSTWNGALGIGAVDTLWPPVRPVSAPTEIAGGHRWLDISVREGGACGVTIETEAFCWGGNAPVHADVPDDAPRHSPFPIGLAGERITVGGNFGGRHACVALGFEVGCWGDNNYGQLGTGDFEEPLSPMLVAGAYIDVDAGDQFTCAITRSRDVDCWGVNGRLQMADGTAIDRPSPVRIELR